MSHSLFCWAVSGTSVGVMAREASRDLMSLSNCLRGVVAVVVADMWWLLL